MISNMRPIDRWRALAACVVLMGCDQRGWDFPVWGPKRGEEPPRVSDSTADAWTAPGEPQAGPEAGPAVDLSPPGQSAAAAAPVADGRTYVLRVHFDVMRVDLPVTETRHSQKIWNHLAETMGDPGLTALLARNGFRAGVGDQADWPALRAIFEHNRARVTRVARAAQDGTPLTIPLGPIADGSSYFLHRRGGGLTGGTLNAGQRSMRIEYALSADDPQRVILRAMPAFQEQDVVAKTVERDGELVVVRDHEGRVFRELAVDVEVGPGQFLVIGESASAAGGFLLGSWWLDSSLELEKFETVLCISARTTRIE